MAIPLSETEHTNPADSGSSSTGPVFREKSLNHVTARKYSHAYLRGSGSVFWMALAAFVIIIIAVFIWANFTSPDYLISILIDGAAY